MEMNVLDKTKDVEIWLTRAEKNDPRLRAQLKDVYAEWKRNGYFVTVFESGEKDLYQGTLDLLAYNKKRLAELEVRRAREANPDKPSVMEKLHTFREQTKSVKPTKLAKWTESCL